MGRWAARAFSLQSRWSSDEFVEWLKRERKLTVAKELASKALDAEGIDLGGAYLAAAAFPCGWFRKAVFAHIDGTGIKFTEARLNNADFYGAQLSFAEFSGAVLDNADFTNATLEAANFSGVSATGANFRNAWLGRTEFYDAVLDHADFTGANFASPSIGARATIQYARSLEGTVLEDAEGLDYDLLQECARKGAIVPGFVEA